MKLIVKTLKGGKFEVEAEDSQTVAQVKEIIEKQQTDLPASTQKLIHSGKVLKDEDVLSDCGIKAGDFLVVMVTKAKKPAPAVAPSNDPAKAPEPVNAPETPAPVAPPAQPEAPPAPSPSSGPSVSEDAVQNLVAMGFPEPEVRHCLRAAHGNPDIAVEFLTNGIPDGVAQVAQAMNTVAGTPAGPAPARPQGEPLQALRNHPQFNALRRLVQSNPQMLQQVLTQIGQQQPELLQEINEHQALFLQMMNEPITEEESAATPATGTAPSAPRRPIADMSSPAAMAQMIQNMSEDELQQMASVMGLSVDQLRQTAQMIGQMPEGQLDQMFSGASAPHAIQLTPEEMAAVDRLAEMGFDRAEAAQAFLACDKNEAMAANLLMDGGFGFGDDDMHDNNNDDNDDNNQGGDNNDEDMYD